MPTVKVYDMSGAEVGTMDLAAELFGVDVKAAVLHSAVRTYLMNQRQGTQSTLTRTEVSGGGKKPWKQKGTGHARQGSTRSPQWTHGGVALGPKPRSYRKAMNKDTKKLALASALSAKVAADSFVVVDDIACTEYKTKNVVSMLKALNAEKKPLIVLGGLNPVFVKSAANIPGAVTTFAFTNEAGKLSSTINVYDILNSEKIVIAKSAVLALQGGYVK